MVPLYLTLELVEAGSSTFESDCEALATGCLVTVTTEDVNIYLSSIGPLFTPVLLVRGTLTGIASPVSAPNKEPVSHSFSTTILVGAATADGTAAAVGVATASRSPAAASGDDANISTIKTLHGA